jgi:RNAse (barnase) inhibitor barstar
MLDKQSAMEHLSKRFGLMDKVTNLDALWDVLSSLNRIEKISLIHSDELIAYEYGQKIMKLLIDYTHFKKITLHVK